MIRESIASVPAVRFERAHFTRFGASSLDFEVVFHVDEPDFEVFMDAQQAVNVALLRRFNDEHIEFAFPTQTVIHLSGDGRRAVGEVVPPGE
jgi:small-conductance mechanosensitive channel